MGFKLEYTLEKKPTDSSAGKGLDNLLKREITFLGSFFNNKQKEEFYGELAILLKASVQLREALNLLKENQKKEKFQEFYGQMVMELDKGSSFSELLKSRKEFTEYEFYSVQIGEESGNLPTIFFELASFFKQKNEQRRNLVNALTYPMIILSTAVLVVVFMLRMVVPMFEDIFKQNGVELPTITLWIIAASNFIKSYGLLVLLVLATLVLLRKPLLKREDIKRRKDYLLLRVPYVGNFVRSVYLTQFTQAVALLTSSKVPMLNSVQMVKRMIDFVPLQDALSTMEAKIMKGVALHDSLKGNKVFDNKLVSLVKVAEETNQTEYIFDKLHQQYATEVQQKSKMLSTIMEPLIIVVIGFFVGVILVSMYLPMFRLSTVLGGE
ncbi:type II secretion system F family protein [Flagellimonas aequoris]|uniref:Type II secretion system F family protein n=1 Tax=Flagellimonas aequoris TaxID=2306997 RepID=A0A418N307_9FLAO|nr:type II secretion system F family protein [Allomuricauda aequoris]RIV68267.1 type II secretion system F family protein [Allomuricauda aequoris]TXJ99957.1 type II secretion system F family protein [Allomuricauda aequoris]